MKKIFAAFFALLLFLGTFSISWGGQPMTTLEEALKGANEELSVLYPERPEIADGYFKTTNLSGKPQNPDRWKESDRRLFVYGEPYGDIKIDEKGSQRYRYIGETAMGEDFLNPFFPHDEWRAGLKLENFMLYQEPWKEPALKSFKIYGKPFRFMPNPFNGQGKYLPYIQEGLKRYWADGIIGESHPMWSKWHEYVYIQQPPTKWTWGLGSAFHIDSRGIKWYIPIPLPSEMDLVVPDLSTTLEAESFTNVNPGDKITSTVMYKLNADHPKEETAWLRLHHVVDGVEYAVKLEPLNPLDAPDEKGYVKLKSGESKKYRYTITVQKQATKVLSRVNPVSVDQDINWENNRAEAPVIPPLYDIRVEVIPDKYSYTAIDKAFISMKIYITRKDTTPISIPFTLSIDGPIGSFTVNKTLAVGDQFEGKYEFGGGPGLHTVSASAWPTGFEDIYPDDNRDSATVSVQSIELTKPDSGIRVELIDGGPTYSR